MTLSNKLTISRIILTFVFMIFLFCSGFVSKLFALIIFIAASITDFLDGYIAKKRNEISDFGKFMDPIADKILIIAAFLAFVEMKLIPAWAVVVIIFRELIITGLRLMALKRGEIIEAGFGGKHKTCVQMLSIILILFFILFKEAGITVCHFWNASTEYWYKQIIFFMILVTVFLTVASGASYIIRNRRYILNGYEAD